MTLEEVIQAHKILQNVECGVDIPPGWVLILHDLATKLEAIPGVVIAQVKEKFGHLRVYHQFGSSDDSLVDRLIAAAEDQAKVTCEVCGKSPAVLNASGWATRCQEHT